MCLTLLPLNVIQFQSVEKIIDSSPIFFSHLFIWLPFGKNNHGVTGKMFHKQAKNGRLSLLYDTTQEKHLNIKSVIEFRIIIGRRGICISGL